MCTESMPAYSTSMSCSSNRYNSSSNITYISASNSTTKENKQRNLAPCYWCPKKGGLYLNQQLQVPVIEEMHLAVPALCHLQRQQHSPVRTGKICGFPGLPRTMCSSGARTACSKPLICADKGIDSILERSVLLQGLSLGSCLSTLSSHQLQSWN